MTANKNMRPSKHARRRMRLYNVSLADLAYLMCHIELEAPSRETGRTEVEGTIPDGRHVRMIVPEADRGVIVTLYPLSPKADR